MRGDSLFILSSCTLRIDKMKKMLQNYESNNDDKVGGFEKLVWVPRESVISETLDKVSVSTIFPQSRSVSVSTTFKFPGLEESQSRHLCKFPVPFFESRRFTVIIVNGISVLSCSFLIKSFINEVMMPNFN